MPQTRLILNLDDDSDDEKHQAAPAAYGGGGGGGYGGGDPSYGGGGYGGGDPGYGGGYNAPPPAPPAHDSDAESLHEAQQDYNEAVDAAADSDASSSELEELQEVRRSLNRLADGVDILTLLRVQAREDLEEEQEDYED